MTDQQARPPATTVGSSPDPEIVGRVAASIAEDPFGPGDPLEVARLTRRALAAAGRKAVEVTELMVIADVVPAPDALARFARRALGPHGAGVRATARPAPGLDRATRESRLTELAARQARGVATASLIIAVCLGPGAWATALCLASRGGATARGARSR